MSNYLSIVGFGHILLSTLFYFILFFWGKNFLFKNVKQICNHRYLWTIETFFILSNPDICYYKMWLSMKGDKSNNRVYLKIGHLHYYNKFKHYIYFVIFQNAKINKVNIHPRVIFHKLIFLSSVTVKCCASYNYEIKYIDFILKSNYSLYPPY